MKIINKSIALAVIACLCNLGHSQINNNDEISTRKYARIQKRMAKQFQKGQEKFKTEKIAKYATPDKYWEQEYLTTINPKLGRPTPEVLTAEIQKLLNQNDAIALQPGTSNSKWQLRGPNNVGGRTRAVAWDPNDAKGKKVWAGAVTGGLWYNNDITSAASSWVSVSDVWANVTVSCIAFDPNDSKIMYVGTGEGWGSSSSTSRGQGIYKSTDGGATFSLISSTSTFYYINDIAVRNESGTSVVYAAVDALYFQGQWNGISGYGLKRSANGGTSWTSAIGNVPSKSYTYSVSDIEIAEDNRIWIGTRNCPYGSSTSDGGGGRVMYSDNGTTWTTNYSHTNNLGRVEIAVAPNDFNTVYALFESSGKADTLIKTRNQGTSWSSMKKPKDADNSIPGTDFTRGQAWYDLTLSVSPLDSNIVIVGGIDLFYSSNSGSSWSQISKWSNNPGLGSLNCSYVHADQHVAVFKPKSLGEIMFGCDGGVFYSANITNSPATKDITSQRNYGYFATQFYAGDLSQTAAKDLYLAGAQDNGTHQLVGTGVSNTNMVTGGDGSFCFISASNNQTQITGYVYNTYYFTTDNWASSDYLLNDGSTGKFINPAIWDDNGSGLFSTKDALTLYRTKITGGTAGTPSTITVKSSGSPGKGSCFWVNKDPLNLKSVLYVGTDIGTVWKTDDAWAATPTFTQMGTLASGNASSLFRHKTTDTMAATVSNYGINNIYISINAGSTWAAKDGDLPDVPVWSIVLNPSKLGEALVATELGVYGTDNIYASSPTWTPYNLGMSAVKTLQLKYRSSDQLLMAVTHGRGVFTSNAWSIKDPIAKFGISDTLPCSNQVVNLIDSSMNNPLNWKWTISTNTNVKFTTGDSTSKSPKIKLTKAGRYFITLTVSNNSGMNSRIKSVTVVDTIAMKMNAFADKTSICKDDTLRLTSTLGDTTMKNLKLKYTWYKNGVVGTSDTNTFMKVLPKQKDSVAYKISATSTYKCAFPKTAFSNVVNVKLTYRNIVIYCNLDTLFILNKPAGGQIDWYLNGVKIGTGTNNFIHATKKGGYRAIYKNGNCVSDSTNRVLLMSVGIKNNPLKYGSRFYPNPSKDFVSFDSKVNGQLEVLNTLGQLMMKESIEVNKSYRINISNLTSGEYLIMVRTDDSYIQIDKLLVN